MHEEKAPPELLEALRAIDPAADLICCGQGHWILGVRAPNPKAIELLEDELRADPHGYYAKLEANAADRDPSLLKEQLLAGRRLELLQLYASGFKPIQLYQVDRPTMAIVHEFKLRDHNWRTRPDAAWAEFREGISVEAADRERTAVLHDYLEQESRFNWHHVFAGAKRFLQRHVFPGSKEATT